MDVFRKIKMILMLALAAGASLCLCVTTVAAAQTQPDIAISGAVTPKDTARYVMEFTTMSSGIGKVENRMMRVDARGFPGLVTPNEAWHMIPGGMKMGKYLPLLRPGLTPGDHSQPEEPEGAGEDKPEDWTTKIYWGCAKEVQSGQPIVITTRNLASNTKLFDVYTKSSPYSMWGAPPNGWGWGQWPNKEWLIPVPRGSSLKGHHFLHGNYLPHIKFEIEQHDFMEELEVRTGDGNLKNYIPVTWKSVKGAVGYFIYAMGTVAEKRETVIWTSSQKATYGIQTHEHSRRIKELVNLGVVLKPGAEECNIPAGIFAECENPMVMVYAWGNDYWVSYPPKPDNAPKDWKPDWTVKGLFLSQWVGMPGIDMPDIAAGVYRGDDDDEVQAGDPEEQTPGKKESGPTININLPGIIIPKLF